MLKMIAAALAAAPDIGDPAVGAWANISFTDSLGGSRTTASTITFTSGGPRTIEVTHDIASGSLEVKIGSGPYVDCPSEHTFEVTTGQLVTFKYTCFGISEAATVTVTDATLVATIDTFTCTFTYTGTPP